VLTRKFKEEFNTTLYLHIWLAYLYPNYRGRAREFMPEVMDYLEKKAMKLGCKYMEMDSPRVGWQRLLMGHNMNKHREVYRKEM